MAGVATVHVVLRAHHGAVGRDHAEGDAVRPRAAQHRDGAAGAVDLRAGVDGAVGAVARSGEGRRDDATRQPRPRVGHRRGHRLAERSGRHGRARERGAQERGAEARLVRRGDHRLRRGLDGHGQAVVAVGQRGPREERVVGADLVDHDLAEPRQAAAQRADERVGRRGVGPHRDLHVPLRPAGPVEPVDERGGHPAQHRAVAGGRARHHRQRHLRRDGHASAADRLLLDREREGVHAHVVGAGDAAQLEVPAPGVLHELGEDRLGQLGCHAREVGIGREPPLRVRRRREDLGHADPAEGPDRHLHERDRVVEPRPTLARDREHARDRHTGGVADGHRDRRQVPLVVGEPVGR